MVVSIIIIFQIYLFNVTTFSLRDESSPSESLKVLVQNCKNLKKIFLAAIRGKFVIYQYFKQYYIIIFWYKD